MTAQPPPPARILLARILPAPALLAMALLSASPAAALTLADLVGRWRGDGVHLIADEPPQRLRCQLRGTPAARGVVVVGRCATAQGGQSFAWALSDLGSGRILAEDRSPVTDDAAPAPSLTGRIGADGLRFDTADGASFQLRRDGDGLLLRLTGTDTDTDRPVRAEARMAPEN
jgi:hypothetical protein